MTNLTAKHLTKDEVVKCNSLLKSVENVNSCLYQTIEKIVVEFINSKEALLIAKSRLVEFKNNEMLKPQLTERLTKAEERFNNAQLAIN
jgi:hypothetical protein